MSPFLHKSTLLLMPLQLGYGSDFMGALFAFPMIIHRSKRLGVENGWKHLSKQDVLWHRPTANYSAPESTAASEDCNSIRVKGKARESRKKAPKFSCSRNVSTPKRECGCLSKMKIQRHRLRSCWNTRWATRPRTWLPTH